MRREFLAVCPKGHRNHLILSDLDGEPREVSCTKMDNRMRACRLRCRVYEVAAIEQHQAEPQIVPHDVATCERPLGACDVCADAYGLVRHS